MDGSGTVVTLSAQLSMVETSPDAWSATKSVQFPAAVTLALPGKLPPLRADQPTLVVGEYTGKLNQFAVTCKGQVNGQSLSVTQNEPVLTRLSVFSST